jgi:hypothetical protein
LLFSRASGADGILSPPGFQFPVKKLVASLKDLMGELHKLSFFGIMGQRTFTYVQREQIFSAVFF